MNRLGRVRPPTLRRQLMLASVTPLVLFGLVSALVFTAGSRSVLQTLAMQRNTMQVQVAAGEMGAILDGYLKPLRATSESLSLDPIDPPVVSLQLGELEPFLQAFDGGVALVNADGIAIGATPGGQQRIGLDYSFREYLQQARETGSAAFSAVLSEIPSGRDAVVIAEPILASGKYAGALIGILFLGDAQAEGASFPLPPTADGGSYLVDASARIIFPAEAHRAGGSMADDPFLLDALEKKEATSRIYLSPRLGEVAIVSYAPLPVSDWSLIVEDSLAIVLAPIMPYLWVGGALLALGIAASLVFLVKGIRSNVGPINRLAAASRLIGAGGEFIPLPVEGPLELQELTTAFNLMVTKQAEQRTAVRRYASQVLRSQEDERKRISRDLHDQTIQDLLGLRQRIELCRGEMVRDPAAAKERLAELQRLIYGAVNDVRRMSNALRPVILEDLGLPAAIQAAVDELGDELPGAQVLFDVEGEPSNLSSELELTVYRIAQEALTNIRKHARSAQHVTAELRYAPDVVLLSVCDDGQGFDAAAAPVVNDDREHLGLAGMHERALLFGGALTIDSAPGEGTRIRLSMPVVDQTP